MGVTYNLSRLEAVAEGDTAFIHQVLTVFVTEVTSDIKKMQSALLVNDPIEVSKLAHKIKPNLILLGLENAASLCIKIEKSRFDPVSTPILQHYLNELQATIAAVIRLLKKDFPI